MELIKNMVMAKYGWITMFSVWAIKMTIHTRYISIHLLAFACSAASYYSDFDMRCIYQGVMSISDWDLLATRGMPISDIYLLVPHPISDAEECCSRCNATRLAYSSNMQSHWKDPARGVFKMVPNKVSGPFETSPDFLRCWNSPEIWIKLWNMNSKFWKRSLCE